MRGTKKGFFITLEGIEGSGKTTQIRALTAWLRKKRRAVVLTREPGGTPFADRVRALLLNSRDKGLTPSMELFLYESARKDHLKEVIEPALKKGRIVLCDRFTDATLAYPGHGRGLSLKMIEDMNQIATHGLKPHLTVLFDLPAEIGLGRAKGRISKIKKGNKEDRFEREALSFHRRVREGYLTLARKEKRRFHILNANQSRHDVFRELCRTLEKYL